jgi:hypothetical protein
MNPLRSKLLIVFAVIAALASTGLYADGGDDYEPPTNRTRKKLSVEERDKRTADRYRETMRADANGMSDKQVIEAYPKWLKEKTGVADSATKTEAPVTTSDQPSKAASGKSNSGEKLPDKAVSDFFRALKK